MADFLPLLSIRNSSLAATSRVCLAGLARRWKRPAIRLRTTTRVGPPVTD